LFSLPKYAKLYAHAEKYKKEGKQVLNTAVSMLLCNCERECATLAMQFLRDKKYNISVSIYDGFHVRRTKQTSVNDKDLRGAEAHVKEKSRYGFHIRLVKKPLSDYNANLVYPEINDLKENDSDYPTYEVVKERFENVDNVAKVCLEGGIFMQKKLYAGDKFGVDMRLYKFDKKTLTNAYEHYVYYDEPGGEPMPFITRWFKDPNMRTYENSVFVSKHETPKIYQRFMGYRASRCEPVAENDAEASHMLQQFKIILRAVSGCEAVGLNKEDTPTYKSVHDGLMWYSHEEEFLTKWFATLLQEPATLPSVNVCIVDPPGAKGTGGTGKDTLILIMKSVLGKAYCVSCDVKQIFGTRFPIDISDVKLINLAEGKMSKEHAGEVRRSTTDTDRPHESKGIDINKHAEQFAGKLQTTNVVEDVFIEEGGRRNFTCQPSDVLMHLMDFWNDVYGTESAPFRFDKPNVARAIYDYLVGVNITGFRLDRNIPKNDIQRRIISRTLEPSLKFWNLIMDEVPRHWLNTYVSKKEVADKYRILFPKDCGNGGNEKTDGTILKDLDAKLRSVGIYQDEKKDGKNLLPGRGVLYKHQHGPRRTAHYKFAFNVLAKLFYDKRYRDSDSWKQEEIEDGTRPVQECWYYEEFA
jgi:hypothetical protein